jgi:hypothetical protein
MVVVTFTATVMVTVTVTVTDTITCRRHGIPFARVPDYGKYYENPNA